MCDVTGSCRALVLVSRSSRMALVTGGGEGYPSLRFGKGIIIVCVCALTRISLKHTRFRINMHSFNCIQLTETQSLEYSTCFYV